jgi:quinol monooxygenase YgiN
VAPKAAVAAFVPSGRVREPGLRDGVDRGATDGSGVVQNEALRVLAQQAGLNRACSATHIAADVDEPNVFWYSEDWQQIEALEAQMRTQRFCHLLALLESAPVAPLLEFRFVGEVRGLEYLAVVREGAEGHCLNEGSPGLASHQRKEEA